MENIEKTACFEDAINKEAKAEIDELLLNAKNKAEELIDSAKKECLEENRRFVMTETAKIKRNFEHMVSQKSFEASKEFLVHRNNRVDEFFSDVEKEILNFTEGSEYDDRLKRIIDGVNAENPITKTSVVYVREKDLEKTKKLFPEFTIKADKNIKLGGATISYPESSIYVDKTIDGAFKAQKLNFVGNALVQG